MRQWDINIYIVGPDGDDIPATCFEKATYMLHESFGKRAKQGMHDEKDKQRVLGVGKRAQRD
jgi:transcription initiation factor TFIID/TFIIF subunit